MLLAPPKIKCAYQIEYNINSKAGTQDLDDEDNDFSLSIDTDEGIIANSIPVPICVKSEAGAHLLGQCSHKVVGQELLKNILSTLDPSLQVARSEECAAHAMQATQVFTLLNQLWGTQAKLETM